MTPDDTPCLNVEDAIENLGGDRELYFDTVGLFLEDVTVQTANLEASLSSGDYAGARRAAHTVKGNAASLGAVRLQQAAMALEHACASGDMAAIAAARPAFVAGVDATIAAFRKLLPAA